MIPAESTLTRALTKDGSARLIFAQTTSIVQQAHQLHQTSKTVTAALGRSLTAAMLMGALCKDSDERITLQIRGDGLIGAVNCTATENGRRVRGFVSHPEIELPPNSKGKLDVGGAIGAGTLTVLRDAPGREPHQGTVELVSGEIAEDITRYFAVSEQTPTVCALGIRADTDCNCVAAGGFLLQLLPGEFQDMIPKLEENIAGLPSVSQFVLDGGDAHRLAEQIFRGMEYDVWEAQSAAWQCDCGKERFEQALRSLNSDELEDMIAAGEPVETRCRWCRSSYRFTPEELQQILRSKAM